MLNFWLLIYRVGVRESVPFFKPEKCIFVENDSFPFGIRCEFVRNPIGHKKPISRQVLPPVIDYFPLYYYSQTAAGRLRCGGVCQTSCRAGFVMGSPILGVVG